MSEGGVVSNPPCRSRGVCAGRLDSSVSPCSWLMPLLLRRIGHASGATYNLRHTRFEPAVAQLGGSTCPSPIQSESS